MGVQRGTNFVVNLVKRLVRKGAEILEHVNLKSLSSNPTVESEEGMERLTIIDGLKDLIKDRESFITKDEPDSIFAQDKQVLEAAIGTIQTQQQLIDKLKKQGRISFTNQQSYIEAQQQEIDRLKVENECQKDLIKQLETDNMNAEMNLEHLTADKDEQAGKLIRYDSGLKHIRERIECFNDMGVLVKKYLLACIDALLGGKEDV